MTKEELEFEIIAVHPLLKNIVDGLTSDPFYDFYRFISKIDIEEKDGDSNFEKNGKEILRWLRNEYHQRYDEEVYDRINDDDPGDNKGEKEVE